MVTTIRVTPTSRGYANALRLLVENGNAEGRTWAWEEIARLIKAAATITPDAWGKEDV